MLKNRFLVCLGFSAATVTAVVAIYYHTFQTRQVRVETEIATPARLAALGRTIPRIVACRERAFQSSPHLRFVDAVSDDDLLILLGSAAPVWQPPTVPSLIHELKLWQSHAVFTTEMLGHPVTGEHIVETLLSDEACRANSSPYGSLYLLDSPYGIRVVELGGEDATENRGDGHFGQLLQALAEGAVPSSMAVTTESGRVGTVVDLFQDTVMRFSWGRELEFVACALAYWTPAGQKCWTNEFGNTFSFDQLLDNLLSIPHGKGACAGCHVPYAIVTILQRDEEDQVLSPAMRKRALRWLANLARQLERRQLSAGGWDRAWTGEMTPVMWNDDVMDRVTVTGHHLEWMAIAPAETLPSREAILRAVGALSRDVSDLALIPRRSFKQLLPIRAGFKTYVDRS
jgi:hypothetical protein